MKLPKELTTVTPLSKYLAMVLFIALPFIGFFLGMRYQEKLNLAKSQQIEQNLSIPRTPTPTPNETVYTEATRSANWKTYRNDKYHFQFQYPTDWMREEGNFPYDNRLNIFILDFNELISEKEYDASPFACEFPPCTKEDYLKVKRDIDMKKIPSYYFITLAGKNAIKTIYYEFHNPSYILQMELYTERGLITLRVSLPVEKVTGTDKEPSKYINENVKKGEQLSQDILEEGIYPNKETEYVVTIFNQILSTFKFTE